MAARTYYLEKLIKLQCTLIVVRRKKEQAAALDIAKNSRRKDTDIAIITCASTRLVRLYDRRRHAMSI